MTAAGYFDSKLCDLYNEVGSKTWNNSDFLLSNLESSKNLFTKESIQKGCPLPKELEVFGLLSGLPFEDPFVKKLIEIQKCIKTIVQDKNQYWVKGVNLGVEYCVFKWPGDLSDNINFEEIHQIMHD